MQIKLLYFKLHKSYRNLYQLNLIAVYNIVDNKEISNYLTHYIVFNTSIYDPKSREQTLNLLYSVSVCKSKVY